MKYTQLKEIERGKIELLLEEGQSFRNIARKIRRNVATISREIKRNRNQNTGQYLADKAHQKAIKNLKEQRYKAPLKNPEIFLYVRQKLRELWTPEEIAGRIKIDLPHLSIHHETIYRYIYNPKKTKGMKLFKYLKLHRKKRMKKQGRKVYKSKILDVIRIDERDKSVLTRQEAGHWETDNLGGKQKDKTSLNGTLERKTRYVNLDKLSDRKSVTKTESLVTDLSQFPPEIVKTITTDNGSENSDHKKWSERIYNIKTFFCNSYHPWEKGSIENLFSRIRRFIPKGTSIDKISKEEIKIIQDKMNNTPRKCLNYLTPNEMMMIELQKIKKT